MISNMAPEPYTISVPQSKLDTLKTKLSLAEFPDELEGAKWDLGSPLSDIKRLTKAWEKWDWRKAEGRLNKVPQYHTGVKVDGFDELDIHFVWQKSEVKNAIPLLFVHGWPGSFIEVIHILPLLTQPGGPAFHVVAPSLPNYGFSEGVKKRGFGAKQYAETCHKLMLQLGYDEYVTQGGDWGYTVTRAIGYLYPNHCKASHYNLFDVNKPTFLTSPIAALHHAITPYTKQEKESLKRSEWFEKEGRGYYAEQSTKPQTLSYALRDSPVALLAWIYEKLHDWTDSYPWTDDEIFTWVSIYQFSRAGPGAAHNIYYEVRHTKPGPNSLTREQLRVYFDKLKLGLAFNPKEIYIPPKAWTKSLGNVVYESHNDSGGHFFATEKPDLLARDLKTMFGKDGGAYGVIKGKSGYDDDRPRL